MRAKLGVLMLLNLASCSDDTGINQRNPQNSSIQSIILSNNQMQYLMKVASIGFDKSDERLPQKKTYLNKAMVDINSRDFASAAENLEKSDGLAPVEVPDFSSWPQRDLIDCISHKIPKTSRISCALKFEIGEIHCDGKHPVNLPEDCMSYYCGSEIFRPSYENTHKSYLKENDLKTIRGAVELVNKFCERLY